MALELIGWIQYRMLARIFQDGGGLIQILSPYNAIRYFLMCLVKLPEFIKRRKLDLVLVDGTIRKRITVKYKRVLITVDCPRMERLLEGENPTFSGMREMYARDVYLKFFDLSKINFRTVVDAGGNRGLFSIFSAKLAEQVIWIEFQDYKYHPVLSILLEDNGPIGKIIEIGALVTGSADQQNPQSKAIRKFYLQSKIARELLKLGSNTRTISMTEILALCVTGGISFLKMDIEGSEFSVMEDADNWLRQVDNIAMEVHREFGDARDIVKTLDRNGFRVITVNAELKPTSALTANYIYASATGAMNVH